MENRISIEVRRFPVVIRNAGTGVVTTDHIIISKEQLQAAQMVHESSKELICRLYGRKGYRVLDIGKAEKRSLCINLSELCGV